MPENVQTMSSVSLALGVQTTSVQATPTPLDDLASVVAVYEPRIFRFLLISLRDRDAAETLTQETFLRAWVSRASFRSDCSVATWLMRIALNLARDHTRTGRFRFWKSVGASAVDVAEVAAHVPERGSSTEARLIAQEQVARIWETVAGLSERQRSIFLLRFVEEMEIPEIATVTGLPTGTVKSHLYRALATVRAHHTPAHRSTESRPADSKASVRKELRQSKETR
jgi:RNA polymerase sigma-70 factor (ECF subfamily)